MQLSIKVKVSSTKSCKQQFSCAAPVDDDAVQQQRGLEFPESAKDKGPGRGWPHSHRGRGTFAQHTILYGSASCGEHKKKNRKTTKLDEKNGSYMFCRNRQGMSTARKSSLSYIFIAPVERPGVCSPPRGHPRKRTATEEVVAAAGSGSTAQLWNSRRGLLRRFVRRSTKAGGVIGPDNPN